MDIISLKKGNKDLLRACFNVSEATISIALRFRGNSLRQKLIRSTAVNTYGGVYLKNI